MDIICDLHTHSIFSIDSVATIESICCAAIDKGIKVVCITDHVDFDSRDTGFGFYNAHDYFVEIDRCKEKYKDKVLLLSGIEFSEPHLYVSEFNFLKEYKYDMIIASAHWLKEGFIGQGYIYENNTMDDVIKMYYDVVEEAIEFEDFDTFAHFDLPKRYNKLFDATRYVNLDRILQKLIDKDIALEINTSSIRKGVEEHMPSNNVLDRFIELGGRRLTVGSDAHSVEEIGMDFNIIQTKYLEFIGIYINRVFYYLKDIEL
jgi:histidinol-phosphatase (PHP family)